MPQACEQSAINVFFHETVNEKTAHEYIRSLGLTAISNSGYSSQELTVSVPAGREDEWIDRITSQLCPFNRTSKHVFVETAL